MEGKDSRSDKIYDLGEVNFFVDLLVDEYCDKDCNGCYTLKESVNEKNEKIVDDFVLIEKPEKEQKFNQGRWSDEEHGLFLEALLIFGKDWPKIVNHIGTRDTTNCRAHAQKFFTSLVKYVENGKGISEPEIEEAKKYIQILSTKS